MTYTETIDGRIKTHDGKVRFKHDVTPTDAYERLYDAALRAGVDAETLPDGTDIGSATVKLTVRRSDRPYIDGRVTQCDVTIRDSLAE